MAESHTAALLLTGGSSRRMGRDKALLVIEGQPLAARTAALLLAVAAPVLEVGPGYTSLGNAREDPPGSGPLAALVAGAGALRRLDHCGPVLVVATDMPRLTLTYLRGLAEFQTPSAEHSAVPRDRSGRPQPLCARYSAAALATAEDLMAGGHRSMGALLEAVPVAWLDEAVDGAGVLWDVDTPEELAALKETAIIQAADR